MKLIDELMAARAEGVSKRRAELLEVFEPFEAEARKLLLECARAGNSCLEVDALAGALGFIGGSRAYEAMNLWLQAEGLGIIKQRSAPPMIIWKKG